MDTAFIEQEHFFPSAGISIAGTLTLPAGDNAPEAGLPALILVTGSGVHDRDETVMGHKPFLRLAAFFAGHGYATLRCDDRGIGGSGGNAAETSFDDSVADARAAFRFLSTISSIDAARISFCGHSEGGLVAATATNGLPVRSVIMLAGPAEPIEALLHRQVEFLSAEAKLTSPQIAHARRTNEAVYAIVRSDLATETAKRDIATLIDQCLRQYPDLSPEAAGRFAQSAEQQAEKMASTVCSPAYRSLLRQYPAQTLSALALPILAIFGGKDCQVAAVENRLAFDAATRHNPDAEAIVFDDMNHLFQVAGTGSISEYTALSPPPAETVMQAMLSWLNRH